MTKLQRIQRAQYVSNKLEELYPEPGIPLLHKDPYTLLVAVLLSAQCTDKRVNLVTPQLWKLASKPEKMAKQKVEDVLKIVKPCGLGPQKSKAIVELSKYSSKSIWAKCPNHLLS